MKKLLLVFVFVSMFFRIAIAGEGMWLPMLLSQLNEAEMQAMGMRMSAEDIYSVNHGSLKDAIVQFGGGCTAEIISDKGLLLTNHHCGYGQIQSHSSVDNNLLENGFWAMSMQDELPNSGLTVTFIENIEDVTKFILEGVKEGMSSKERQSIIDKNIADFKKKVKLAKYLDMIIKPFFKGNQYFAFITKVYKDVRLVGAPPQSIGKFGSDTDNWVWPRHTGDFSMFRIYADKDNNPAEYSEDNVPYKPKHFLPVSLDGVEEGDFTLIFGFPGRTNEYLPSVAIKQLVDVINPAKINIREKALAIMGAEMKANKEIKIKYASKYAGIANYWKKWIGESLGLTRTNAVRKKQLQEKDFMERVSRNRLLRKRYGKLFDNFESLYKDIEVYSLTKDVYFETFFRSVDATKVAGYSTRLEKMFKDNGEEGFKNYAGRLMGYFGGVYKNFDSKLDEKVFSALMENFVQNIDSIYISNQLKVDDFNKLANDIYSSTIFTDKLKLFEILNMKAEEAIKILNNDPLYSLVKSQKLLIDDSVNSKFDELNIELKENQRLYMKALIEVYPKKRYYPDANSTMRVTYGKVEGYEAKDAVRYTEKTYLKGVIEKYVPGDYEFDVPQKLRDLYSAKDFGDYDENGRMPVGFIGTNHTTGGNSGSPVIDAYGNIIGLNFDRVWEGTMSDINYDSSICRNIMVDIRYVMFIIDKYAGASNIIEEIKFVHPKKDK